MLSDDDCVLYSLWLCGNNNCAYLILCTVNNEKNKQTSFENESSKLDNVYKMD